MILHVGRWPKAIALLSLFTQAGTAGANPIRFSLTGTPDADAVTYGYTESQNYTFTWTLNTGFTNNASSFFTGSWNGWCDDYSYEAPLFSDFSGDGLTGSWQRPVDGITDPYSCLDVYSTKVELLAQNEAIPHQSIGLQVNGVDIFWVSATAVIDISPSFPGYYTDPNDYFAPSTGTYLPTGGGVNIGLTNGDVLYFSPTSFTISQIPEPSSGVLIMCVAGGLVFIRRRLRM
jgi:hypothetical protein